MDIVEDILTHHGTLGMKWGRRKASSGAEDIVIRDKGKKLKTSGGRGHPSHMDAVKSRTSGQIAKKSGTKALSNQQLEAYNKRLNLEQNFKRLSYNDKNAGQKFIATLLGQTGKNQAHAVANEVATQQVKKHVLSKIAVTTAAA